MHDVIIVGGGVIGLSVARELALHGRSTLVLDRGNLRDATSWAAAGMIAPQSETDAPSPFFDLCMASAKLYPAWTTRLHEESGVDPEFADSGLLFVASTEEAWCRIRRNLEWQNALGLSADLLSPEDALRLEPRLTLPLVGAAWIRQECHVTPRRLLEALTGACAVKGVDVRGGMTVLEVLQERGRVTGVRTATEHFQARSVVIASGVRSPEIKGLSPAIPVAPRKGQILSLKTRPDGPDRPAAFTHMIRWEHAYMVPRRSGDLVIGATNEDVGFDRSITPAGVGGLLQSAQQISSHLADLPIGEIWTGLRPATPDGLPIIGETAVEGLLYATGHYRNGILLAPVTAAVILSLMENRAVPAPMDAFAPSRFAV